MARIWEVGAKMVGKPPCFKSPEEMLERAIKYFEWCEENPLNEHKIFAQQGMIIDGEVKRKRAYTQAGLCLFLGISEDTWRNYRDKKPEYFEVTKFITDVIYEEKFVGSAAGLYNQNIIARDLGLKDNSEVDHKSSDGSMSPQATSEAVLDILKKKHAE